MVTTGGGGFPLPSLGGIGGLILALVVIAAVVIAIKYFMDN